MPQPCRREVTGQKRGAGPDRRQKPYVWTCVCLYPVGRVPDADEGFNSAFLLEQSPVGWPPVDELDKLCQVRVLMRVSVSSRQPVLCDFPVTWKMPYLLRTTAASERNLSLQMQVVIPASPAKSQDGLLAFMTMAPPPRSTPRPLPPFTPWLRRHGYGSGPRRPSEHETNDTQQPLPLAMDVWI